MNKVVLPYPRDAVAIVGHAIVGVVAVVADCSGHRTDPSSAMIARDGRLESVPFRDLWILPDAWGRFPSPEEASHLGVFVIRQGTPGDADEHKLVQVAGRPPDCSSAVQWGVEQLWEITHQWFVAGTLAAPVDQFMERLAAALPDCEVSRTPKAFHQFPTRSAKARKWPALLSDYYVKDVQVVGPSFHAIVATFREAISSADAARAMRGPQAPGPGSLTSIEARVKELPNTRSLAGAKAHFRSAVNALGEIFHASGYGGYSFWTTRQRDPTATRDALSRAEAEWKLGDEELLSWQRARREARSDGEP